MSSYSQSHTRAIFLPISSVRRAKLLGAAACLSFLLQFFFAIICKLRVAKKLMYRIANLYKHKQTDNFLNAEPTNKY